MTGSVTEPLRSGARVVAAAQLADDVRQQRAEHRQAVPDPAGRAGQVHDQRATRRPGHTAGEHRRRHVLRAEPADRLGDPGCLPLQHGPGGLRRDVGGRQAGPPGGEDDVASGVHRRAPHGGELPDVVGADVRPLHGEAELAQPFGEHLPAAVLVDAGGGPVRGGDDDGAGVRRQPAHRTHSPVFPPLLASSRTSVIVARGSTAFTMSIIARPATATDVRASISTPVRSAVRAVAVISTASSVTSIATVTPCRAIGWQSGTRSGVRLAPAMPAIRATATASPFGTPDPRSSATTSGLTITRPAAVATRVVTHFSLTSTIRAAPASSTWVNRASFTGGLL